MQNFTENLHDELKSKLQMLEDDPHSEKFRAERRIGLIIKTINEILKKLETHRFPSEKEEIHLFQIRSALYHFTPCLLRWQKRLGIG